MCCCAYAGRKRPASRQSGKFGRDRIGRPPAHHSAVAYLFEGAAFFAAENEPVSSVRMIAFDEGDCVRVRASANAHARLMLIAGAPFNESIVPYGPFVMNTEEEIRQALLDLRNGTFVQR